MRMPLFRAAFFSGAYAFLLCCACLSPVAAQEFVAASDYLGDQSAVVSAPIAWGDAIGSEIQPVNHFSYHTAAEANFGGCAACGCNCNKSCACDNSQPAKPNPCATSHKGLFYANDFSYLNDPKYDGCCLGDALKLIPVDPCGRWGTVDFGGQMRLRYHHEEGMAQDSIVGNERFLDTQTDFLLSRFRLYTNWKVNDWLRVYVEGIYADVGGSGNYIPRPIDRNHGDLLNAFVDVGVTENTTVRVGRQELLYGNQRLVSPLDWANTRRTFEGVKVMYKSDNWAWDNFYTNFVPVDPFDFDEADYDRKFYGSWATYSGCENRTLDLFYLGFDNQTAAFSLHTMGARVLGNQDGMLWEMQGAGQFGDAAGVTGTDHSAAMATIGLGRAMSDLPWQPTVWFYFDYASGNPSANVVGDNNAFNQLFPLAHKYLGFIDAIQRTNIESPNILLTAKPCQKLNLLLWYYHFESNGASPVPSIGGTPTQNGFNYLGNELDFIVKYNMAPRSNVLFGYSHFWRGSKIVNPSDADFAYLQWELNF